MERDSYWRTRTIAEAQSQGYTGPRAPGAGVLPDIPLQTLRDPPGVVPESFIGNLPLRCQKCGNTAPTIGVSHRVCQPGELPPLAV